MNVSLRRYYKSFGSLYAFVAGIPFLLPLLNLYQSHATEYLYPPLGDAQSLFFGLTFALMLMTTFAVYVSCRAARRIHPLVPFLLILAFTIGAGCVMALDIRCVRVVDVPTKNLEVPLSIGFDRSDFALSTYPNWTDYAMLQDRGPVEEKIKELWTMKSIWEARFLLWAAYSVTLSLLLAVACVGVYQFAGCNLG